MALHGLIKERGGEERAAGRAKMIISASRSRAVSLSEEGGVDTAVRAET